MKTIQMKHGKVLVTDKNTYCLPLCVFNGDNYIALPNTAVEIFENNYNNKIELVEAFKNIGICLDTTQRISVEDGEMSQYHYFG